MHIYAYWHSSNSLLWCIENTILTLILRLLQQTDSHRFYSNFESDNTKIRDGVANCTKCLVNFRCLWFWPVSDTYIDTRIQNTEHSTTCTLTQRERVRHVRMRAYVCTRMWIRYDTYVHNDEPMRDWTHGKWTKLNQMYICTYLKTTNKERGRHFDIFLCIARYMPFVYTVCTCACELDMCAWCVSFVQCNISSHHINSYIFLLVSSRHTAVRAVLCMCRLRKRIILFIRVCTYTHTHTHQQTNTCSHTVGNWKVFVVFVCIELKHSLVRYILVYALFWFVAIERTAYTQSRTPEQATTTTTTTTTTTATATTTKKQQQRREINLFFHYYCYYHYSLLLYGFCAHARLCSPILADSLIYTLGYMHIHIHLCSLLHTH